MAADCPAQRPRVNTRPAQPRAKPLPARDNRVRIVEGSHFDGQGATR